MSEINMFHDGSRDLQQQFGTTALADRLVETRTHATFTEEDAAFIETRSFFFLSTADSSGRPDCSHKGGDPGFVRVLDATTLVFPDYDGNGMFKSLGNISVNPYVGLLFIDFERPKRLRVNGRATVSTTDNLIASYEGAQAIITIVPEAIFPNCPRYIHKIQESEISEYVPRRGHTPPTPEWKTWPFLNEVLPDGDPAKGQPD